MKDEFYKYLDPGKFYFIFEQILAGKSTNAQLVGEGATFWAYKVKQGTFDYCLKISKAVYRDVSYHQDSCYLALRHLAQITKEKVLPLVPPLEVFSPNVEQWFYAMPWGELLPRPMPDIQELKKQFSEQLAKVGLVHSDILQLRRSASVVFNVDFSDLKIK